MNKVLDEIDIPPVMVIHDLMVMLKLGRHIKDKFQHSKKGQELRRQRGKLFALLAQTYLFSYNHDPFGRREFRPPGNWDIFLNIVNVEAELGVNRKNW